MKKRFWLLFVAIAICSALTDNVFASAIQLTPVLPQHIQNEQQLSRYIESVLQDNKDLSNESALDSPVAATITFSKYISFEELQDYMSMFGIELQQIQLRGLEPDGTRVTIATLAHMGMDYTEQLMYDQATAQGFELIGITDIYAYVLPSKIEAISEHELTYLIESIAVNSTDTYSLNDEKQMEKAEENKTVFPKSITWELEDLNLL